MWCRPHPTGIVHIEAYGDTSVSTSLREINPLIDEWEEIQKVPALEVGL